MDEEFNKEFLMQSELQRSQGDMDRSMNANYLKEQQQTTAAALVEQINPAHLIKELELKLKGQVIDPVTDKLIFKADPLMNDKGIGQVIIIVSGIVNQNTILSSLTEPEIGKLILNTLNTLIDDLVLNWKEYGIKDKMKLDVIHDLVANSTFPALKRALMSGERKFLSTTTVESISSKPNSSLVGKKGPFSKFSLNS